MDKRKQAKKKKSVHVQELFDKKVYVHLDIKEHAVLEELMEGTKFQTMGELFRHILDGKTVNAEFVDTISDELLDEIETMSLEMEIKDRAIHWMAKRVYNMAGDPSELLENATAAVRVYKGVEDLIPSLHELVKEVSKR